MAHSQLAGLRRQAPLPPGCAAYKVVTALVFTGARMSELLDADIEDRARADAQRCRVNGCFPYTERTWSGLSPGSGPDRAWQPVAKQIRRVWDRPCLATGNS